MTKNLELGPVFEGLPNHIKVGDIAIYFGRRGIPPDSDITSIRIVDRNNPQKILFVKSFER